MTIRTTHRNESESQDRSGAHVAEDRSGLIDIGSVTESNVQDGKLRERNLTWEDLLIWGGVSVGLLFTLMLGLLAWWI